MRNRVLCILSIALLAMATGVAAQATDPATTQKVSGTVVSSSSTSLVIDTDAGNRQTFMVDSQSTIPTGLAPGSRISVDYHALAGGELHAAQVTTLGAAAPAAPTAPSQPVTEAAPVETTPPADTTSATGTASATGTETPTSPRKMPATASPLPLVSLIGLAALAGGAALRRFNR